MEQEIIAALVKLIMTDPRFLELMKGEPQKEKEDLILIEKKETYDKLPQDCKAAVYCQEFCQGNHGFLSYEEAVNGKWKNLKLYNPSFNFIAKLALGLADEPILKLFQNQLLEGKGNLELIHVSNLSEIKSVSYRNLFLAYLETIKSFGIKVSGAADFRDTRLWEKRALTEKDLLNMEPGIVITVDSKCIVTSLAADLAGRKGIQICRKGEIR